eukprot:gene5461-9279_t
MLSSRTTEIFIGILFLGAIVAYGSGTGIIDSILDSENYLTEISKNKTTFVTGTLLMLTNSVIVITIGILFYPILEKINKNVADTYYTIRVIEGVLLAFGIINLSCISVLSEVFLKSGDAQYIQTMVLLLRKFNFYSYQIAMINLGFGSLFFCFTLFQYQVIPSLFSIWGFFGYLLLTAGSIAELFGYEIGLILCIPGGLFEMALPFWLFFKGLSVEKKK